LGIVSISIHSSIFIDFVNPSLVQINDENNVIFETTEPIKSGHSDNKGEKVVDDGVKELVNHHFPGQMFN
jgi:hypothetical protein